MPRETKPIRTQTQPGAHDGQGLARQDSPGTRSGEGSRSVLDQMQKDERRNANHSDGQEVPRAARDSTG